MNRAVGGWRFAGELFEHAIELRKRLKPDGKGNLADSKIDIVQEFRRSLKPDTCDVIDELHAGDLLKLFAQMRRIDSDCFCHSVEREEVGCVLFAKFARS